MALEKGKPRVAGKPLAVHPDGLEIYSRDQRESFILHANNLSQELLKGFRHFVDAQISLAHLVCKEVTGARSPETLAEVIASLRKSEEGLGHATGPFGYLDTIVLELQKIDLAEKHIDLQAIGDSLVRDEAVKDVAWSLSKEAIKKADFKEAYNTIKEHIAEVKARNEKIIAALQREPGAAREGTAAYRLMKMRPVNIAVEFGTLRSAWHTLLDIVFIAEICGKECWYNLKNYRPVLPHAPGV